MHFTCGWNGHAACHNEVSAGSVYDLRRTPQGGEVGSGTSGRIRPQLESRTEKEVMPRNVISTGVQSGSPT